MQHTLSHSYSYAHKYSKRQLLCNTHTHTKRHYHNGIYGQEDIAITGFYERQFLWQFCCLCNVKSSLARIKSWLDCWWVCVCVAVCVGVSHTQKLEMLSKSGQPHDMCMKTQQNTTHRLTVRQTDIYSANEGDVSTIKFWPIPWKTHTQN